MLISSAPPPSAAVRSRPSTARSTTSSTPSSAALDPLRRPGRHASTWEDGALKLTVDLPGVPQ